MDSHTRRRTTPARAGGRPTTQKGAIREAVETGWHLVVVAIAVPAVAARIARSRRLSAGAITLLVTGAAWHITVAAAGRRAATD